MVAAHLLLACTLPAFSFAQANNSQTAGSTPPQPPPAARAHIARWLEIQNATLNLRYRFIDNSAGVVLTKQVQHRESLRARIKFDPAGRYSLNAGLFTGTRFTSGWDNTALGPADGQRNIAFRGMFLSATPVRGIEGQYGGLYLIRGESTEITTYDEDGYIVGERVSVRRPADLYFDEISVTVGYLTPDPREIPISKRTKYLNDAPNYRHFLVDKKFGKRAGISTDFTTADGAHTWRQAINLKTPELRVVDTVIFENYERTNHDADYGFAVTVDKAVNRRISMNGGYASIDTRYGGLNADRFHVGNRLFGMLTFNISPEFLASAFITRAIGNDTDVPQRTLANLVFTYNALPTLRRTGVF